MLTHRKRLFNLNSANRTQEKFHSQLTRRSAVRAMLMWPNANLQWYICCMCPIYEPWIYVLIAFATAPQHSSRPVCVCVLTAQSTTHFSFSPSSRSTRAIKGLLCIYVRIYTIHRRIIKWESRFNCALWKSEQSTTSRMRVHLEYHQTKIRLLWYIVDRKAVDVER